MRKRDRQRDIGLEKRRDIAVVMAMEEKGKERADYAR